jgi:hypothetical protein
MCISQNSVAGNVEALTSHWPASAIRSQSGSEPFVDHSPPSHHRCMVVVWIVFAQIRD